MLVISHLRPSDTSSTTHSKELKPNDRGAPTGRSRIDIPETPQSYWALAGSGGGRTLRDGQVRPKELLIHVFYLVLWPAMPDPGASIP